MKTRFSVFHSSPNVEIVILKDGSEFGGGEVVKYFWKQ